jgi:DNA-binding IclR family transcriptional regulator
MSTNRDPYLINSVLRAAQILESFSFHKSAYTNSELSKVLGLNRSTVTRLLYSLERAGFVERNGKTREYRLTHRLFRIGSVYINQVSLHTEAMPLLLNLASWCKETVHLAVLNDGEVFYLDKVESPQSIGMRSRIGNKSPAYATGVGKVMLAYLDEGILEAYLKSTKLKAYTAKTIAHSVNGDVIAGISISGPVFRINQKEVETKFINAVRETANAISNRLGYLGE